MPSTLDAYKQTHSPCPVTEGKIGYCSFISNAVFQPTLRIVVTYIFLIKMLKTHRCRLGGLVEGGGGSRLWPYM